MLFGYIMVTKQSSDVIYQWVPRIKKYIKLKKIGKKNGRNKTRRKNI